MANAGEVQVNATVNHTIASSSIAVGISTYLGVGLSIFAALGALYGAIVSNDTATIGLATTALLSAVSTIGSRGAQAVAAIKSAAVIAEPVVKAASDYSAEDVHDHEVDEVPYEQLPTDAQEFDQRPWEEVEKALESGTTES